MKRIVLILVLFTFYLSSAQEWHVNFSEAQTLAKEQNTKMLILFSGSDWCVPCIKLDKTIFQTDEFKKYSENLVLFRADFPKKKQNQLPEAQAQQNKQLAERYNSEGVFPLVVVVNELGKVLGKMSYQNVSPEAYIEILDNIVKK